MTDSVKFNGTPIVWDAPNRPMMAPHAWWGSVPSATPALSEPELQKKILELWQKVVKEQGSAETVFLIRPHPWRLQFWRFGYFIRKWNRKTAKHRRLNFT